MTSGRRKIAVIGAGNVGATCAFVLAQMKVADIVLLDIFEGFAKGKALDMSQNSNVLNYDGTITGTADYNDIAGSDVVVVTS
ncbi:MAG: malate dehydrogenase, partial [Methanobacteriota archaeon]